MRIMPPITAMAASPRHPAGHCEETTADEANGSHGGGESPLEGGVAIFVATVAMGVKRLAPRRGLAGQRAA